MKITPVFEVVRLPCGKPIVKLERRPNIMQQVKP